jgi:methionine-rich copper-binding protein CopC
MFNIGGFLMRFAHSRMLALVLTTATVISTMLVLALPEVASAHAAYVSSDPAANSTLKAAPTKVTITFAQALDPKGMSIIVYDDKAKVVSTGTAQISFANNKVASITMTGDGSDIYRVDWTTLSADDGDSTLGAFVFGVDPSGQTDKVPPDQAASATPPSSSAGVSTIWAIIIGLAGLVIGAGATYFYIQQQSPTQHSS